MFFCPYCKSKDTIWYGKRYNKTEIKSKRKCKSCRRVYTNQPSRAKGKKNTLESINLAINIAKDHSLRETESILKEKYGIQITHASISNWKKQHEALLKKIEIVEKDDPDWIYKPILKTNTRPDYDGNKIEAEWMDV